MEIRRVTPSEWCEYRDIRLAALLDTPDAFGSTYPESVLGVVDGNDAARGLYASYGFAFNGVTNPLRKASR